MKPILDPQALRRARRDSGLSAGRLANIIGVSEVTVRTWEYGTYRPREKNIVKLAAALAVDVSDLTLAVCPTCERPLEDS